MRRDVANVLLTATLGKVGDLPNDHIFRRGERQLADHAPILQSPRKERIIVRGVKIRLQAGWEMNNTKVSPAVALNFRRQNVLGRGVEIRLGKSPTKFRKSLGRNGHGEVDVKRKPGFRVVHRAERTRDEVTKVFLRERNSKDFKEVRFLHG